MKKYIIRIFLSMLFFVGVFFIVKEFKLSNSEKVIDTELAVGQNNVNENIEQQENEIEESSETKSEENNYINLPIEQIRIPILMYHSISDGDPNNSLLVPPTLFEEHMKWLYDNGFTAMSLKEVDIARETGEVPEKPVVISFDDGYADNYTDAYPILKKYGLKGTFFIITSKVDKDGFYMSSSMLKEMDSENMEIENHTNNHVELNGLSREEQIIEIQTAQNFLKDIVGGESKYLCYPVGRYNDNTIEVAEELGIKLAVTTEGGISGFEDGDYQLKRVRVSPMSIESFSSIFEEFMD